MHNYIFVLRRRRRRGDSSSSTYSSLTLFQVEKKGHNSDGFWPELYDLVNVHPFLTPKIMPASNGKA